MTLSLTNTNRCPAYPFFWYENRACLHPRGSRLSSGLWRTIAADEYRLWPSRRRFYQLFHSWQQHHTSRVQVGCQQECVRSTHFYLFFFLLTIYSLYIVYLFIGKFVLTYIGTVRKSGTLIQSHQLTVGPVLLSDCRPPDICCFEAQISTSSLPTACQEAR